VGRIIAISGGDLDSTRSINRYAINMLKTGTKQVLYIGTASMETAKDRDDFCAEFERLGCEVKTLELITQQHEENYIDGLLAWADIIYVGGGDTIFLRNVWKEYGIDNRLREIYQKDSAILMGISAGAICMFECGITDSELAHRQRGLSFGWADQMLGIAAGGFCPHFEERTEEFDELIDLKRVNIHAMESNSAYVYENGEIRYLKCKPDVKAYFYRYEDNIRYVKEELELIQV